ncbi:unnamed protein product [Lepeophtheirus salmonis]|uniref:(salmon louse) hypothetical protein n=1 Tax=Lepeophtheirus salmonis TaxID=72036 RepID=A0A7R8CKL7_LEPSM|nr:unnamed protein product [Lepeophtheirus salmonis]CAF2849895.1 unnamed protein product [Lepeophtheirus salmonis]
MYATALETEEDLDFVICETASRKVNQSISRARWCISYPLTCHPTTCSTIGRKSEIFKSSGTNISAGYQIDDLDFPSTYSDTIVDRDSIPKAVELDRLCNAIKEKLSTASYCTLHPIVIYVLADEGNLKHDSLCFVSNDNTHVTAFVYEVQTMMTHEDTKAVGGFSFNSTPEASVIKPSIYDTHWWVGMVEC